MNDRYRVGAGRVLVVAALSITLTGGCGDGCHAGDDLNDDDIVDDDNDPGGIDADGDGWFADGGDCNDDDPEIHPQAPAPCVDGDANCDGLNDKESPLCGVVALGTADGVSLPGTTTVSIGDSNGDGRDDLLFGIPHLACDDGGTCGAAVLLLSPFHGLIDIETETFSDVTAFMVGRGEIGFVGNDVDLHGDLDGDGYHDVVIGAPWHAQGVSSTERTGGTVLVQYGPVEGEMNPANADARFWIDVDYAGVGRALETGDIDGDGLDDLLVGAWANEGSEDGNTIVFVLTGPLEGDLGAQDVAARIVAPSIYETSFQLLASADLDDNGARDIVIGLDGDSEHEEQWGGDVYVFLSPWEGDRRTTDGADRHFDGGAGPTEIGVLGPLGDGDGDDIGDILFVADEIVENSDLGLTYLASGPSTVAEGGAVIEEIGVPLRITAAAGALGGDYNADGYGDLVLGSAITETVYVFLGPIDGPRQPRQADGEIIIDDDSLDFLEGHTEHGDVDGDGIDDLVVVIGEPTGQGIRIVHGGR